MLISFKNVLIAIPSKAAPLVIGEDDVNRVVDILEKDIYEALAQLVEYDPTQISGEYTGYAEEDDEAEDEGRQPNKIIIMAKRPKSHERTRDLFVRVIQKALESPEKITVSQWAEKYRQLDESSNFSGKWSNDITPYLVGVMDAFNDPYIQEINFCKSTQVGGTEALINMIGYIVTHDPSPTMIVYPNDDLAKDISRDRLQPSLMKTPETAERFTKRRRKNSTLNSEECIYT